MNKPASIFLKLPIMLFITLFMVLSSVSVRAALTELEVSQLYVSIFNRASEGEGNQYWRTSKPDMATTADVMLETDAAKQYFGTSLNSNQAFIEHIYLNTLNKTPSDDPNGIAYWTGLLDGGMPRGQVVSSMVSVINDYAPDGVSYNPDDVITVAAYNQFSNRVIVSSYMADKVQNTPEDWATSTSFSVGLIVTDASETILYAMDAIDAIAARMDSGTTPGSINIQLGVGGTFELNEGVVVRVLENSGAGSVDGEVSSSGEAGGMEGPAQIVSREYEFNSGRLHRGDLTSPMLVSLPVSRSLVLADADPYSFDVQVYNTQTDQWDWVDGWAFFDPDDQDVSFWTGHFSRYRVLHSEPSDRDNYDRYRVNNGNFQLYYYEPNLLLFGAEYPYAPPRDTDWAPVSGSTDTDPDIWNYIEDLGEALEDSLAYYLTLSTSSGTHLFSAPPPTEPINTYVTYLPKRDAAGDSKLGIMRIATSLENYSELAKTATHELAHVLSTQRYTPLGAAYNRWFYEAIADLWTSRALGMTRTEQITFFSKTKSNYLRVPLDASDEGSYYAAADFLYWLEKETGKAIAADVVAANETNDLNALSNLASNSSVNFSDYYIKYVLQASLGEHDFNVPLVDRFHPLTLTSTGLKKNIENRHLSATGVGIVTDMNVDGMLVVTSDISADAGNLKTFSYKGSPQNVANYLESELNPGEAIVIEHFGKTGTAGVNASKFIQIVINPELADSNDMVYALEAYLLLPPRTQISEGRVDYTLDANYPSNMQPIAGYNVYLSGEKLNGIPLPFGSDSYEQSKIHAGSDVVVTVVDTYGNEWPKAPVLTTTEPYRFAAAAIFDIQSDWTVTESRDGRVVAESEWLNDGAWGDGRLRKCQAIFDWARPTSHDVPLQMTITRKLYLDGEPYKETFFIQDVSYSGPLFLLGNSTYASRNGTWLDPDTTWSYSDDGFVKTLSYLPPERIESFYYDKEPNIYVAVKFLCGGREITEVRFDYTVDSKQ